MKRPTVLSFETRPNHCNRHRRWMLAGSCCVQAVVWLVVTVGCAKPLHSIGRPPVPPVEMDAHARTGITFDWGAFYKPREGSLGGLEATLAPLIVQQLRGEKPGDVDAQRFGTAVEKDGGRFLVDAVAPIIYADSRMLRWGRHEYPQVQYVWYYPAEGGDGPMPMHVMVALRITLGDDGFPLVYEVSRVAHGAPRETVLFVSKSLERRAVEVFGRPLPGRRYAIERGTGEAETAGVVVAGLVEDGPIPMGPYVYLASDTHRVTTVLCRCSPSQVNAFAESAYYELQPLGDLPYDMKRFRLSKILRWPE